MQTFGFALLAIAFLATLVGFAQRQKGKKILATPFRRTGELAATGQGTVSCEGAVQVQAPAIAPVSGKACLYYEVELVQEWSKSVATEDGVKEEKGTTTLSTTKNGAVFYVNDGSGPMGVDPRQGMDVELEKSFEQSQPMSHGSFTMGQFHAHVPHPGDGKSGRSVKVIEKIVPVDGKLFVLGHVDPFRNITKPTTMLGSLMASRKGRDALLGATKRNATIGFVAGALFMLPGGVMAAFGEPMATDSLSLKGCQIQDESAAGAPCTGKIYGDYGSDVTFAVTKAATFQISGAAPVGKKLPLIAKLDIKDAAGKAMIKDAPGMAKVDLAPGTYTINIRDSIPGAAKNFKGGFSYEIAVKRVSLAQPVVAAAPTVLPPGPVAANVAKAASPDPAAEEKPAKGKKGKKGKGKKAKKGTEVASL